MEQFRSYVVIVLRATALACVAVVCLAAVGALVFLAVSPLAHTRILTAIGIVQTDAEQKENKEREKREALEKYEQARSWKEVSPHHWRVAGWILECTKIREIPKLPHYLRPTFDRTFTEYSDYKPLSADLVWPVRLPHHHEIALIQLSNALGDHRVSLHAKVRTTFQTAQVANILTVVLGLLTTVLVSISSTKYGQEEGRWQPWVRILAIIFPALGTAAAAIVAFYSPQSEWTQASRTLASLTQLHNQIALDTWKLDCFEFDDNHNLKSSESNKQIKLKFEDWTKRYYELQAVAGSSGQADKLPGSTGSIHPSNDPGSSTNN